MIVYDTAEVMPPKPDAQGPAGIQRRYDHHIGEDRWLQSGVKQRKACGKHTRLRLKTANETRSTA